METWIGLARNGMCVIHDMEWAGQGLLGPVQSFLPDMNVMNGVIAPLQAAAVYFNFVSGADLYATSVVTRNVMLNWKVALTSGGLEKWSTGREIAHQNATAAAVAARKDLYSAVCCFACSFGFIWLVLNSMKVVYVDLINWGLIGMEVALVYFLITMVDGVLELWKKATDATEAAAKLEAEGESYISDAPYSVVSLVATALEIPEPSAPWPAPAETYLAEAYCAALQSWKRDVAKATKTIKGRDKAIAALRGKALGDYRMGWLEVVLTALNVAAFVGYAVFPVTYLVPAPTLAALSWWPGNDPAEWLGNFVGDFCWTVEPALLLTVKPYIIAQAKAKTTELLTTNKKVK